MNYNDKIAKLNEEILSFKMLYYEELPDIDLYMDQVLAFLNKHLSLFNKSDSDSMLTPAMINNYVKFELVPPPVAKKYSKRHLAYIYAICLLKQVLKMDEIKKLITFLIQESDEKTAYEIFCSTLEKAIHGCVNNSEITKKYVENEPTLALRFAGIAIATKMYSQKIIHLQNDDEMS
ncbi:MAG: DUF1836 domain-containing protein [Christensenellales bacterium]